jgi:hypothetical protein
VDKPVEPNVNTIKAVPNTDDCGASEYGGGQEVNPEGVWLTPTGLRHEAPATETLPLGLATNHRPVKVSGESPYQRSESRKAGASHTVCSWPVNGILPKKGLLH